MGFERLHGVCERQFHIAFPDIAAWARLITAFDCPSLEFAVFAAPELRHLSRSIAGAEEPTVVEGELQHVSVALGLLNTHVNVEIFEEIPADHQASREWHGVGEMHGANSVKVVVERDSAAQDLRDLSAGVVPIRRLGPEIEIVEHELTISDAVATNEPPPVGGVWSSGDDAVVGGIENALSPDLTEIEAIAVDPQGVGNLSGHRTDLRTPCHAVAGLRAPDSRRLQHSAPGSPVRLLE